MAKDVKYHPLVLGGEAALWGEEADTQDVPMKVIMSDGILSLAINCSFFYLSVRKRG